jgi:hypothetical protein
MLAGSVSVPVGVAAAFNRPASPVGQQARAGVAAQVRSSCPSNAGCLVVAAHTLVQLIARPCTC